MSRLLRRALAALGVLAAVSTAQAGTLSYDGYSVFNGQNVAVTDASLGVDELGGAGQIILFTDDAVGFALAAWCIDISDMLLASGQYSTGTFLSGPFGSTVNALLSNVTPLLDSDPNVSAALQVAIWKAEYGGDLTVTVADPVTALADQYLRLVSDGTFRPDPTMGVTVLAAQGNQNLVYLAPVQEPVSIALLGTGLVGAALARRWLSRTS
jgi:hypothetical protein